MEKKYFANLEHHEVNGVFIPDIELPEEKLNSIKAARLFSLPLCLKMRRGK